MKNKKRDRIVRCGLQEKSHIPSVSARVSAEVAGSAHIGAALASHEIGVEGGVTLDHFADGLTILAVVEECLPGSLHLFVHLQLFGDCSTDVWIVLPQRKACPQIVEGFESFSVELLRSEGA